MKTGCFPSLQVPGVVLTSLGRVPSFLGPEASFLFLDFFFLCLAQNVFLCLPEKGSWEPGSQLAGLSLSAPAHVTGSGGLESSWKPFASDALRQFLPAS